MHKQMREDKVMSKILLIYENQTFCQEIDRIIRRESIVHKISVLDIETNALQTLSEITYFGADYIVLEMRKEMSALVVELLVKSCQIPQKKNC